MSKQKLTHEQRDRIIARVIDDLSQQPLAVARVTASSLYSEQGLALCTDVILKKNLASSLIEYFTGKNITPPTAMDYWRSLQ